MAGQSSESELRTQLDQLTKSHAQLTTQHTQSCTALDDANKQVLDVTASLESSKSQLEIESKSSEVTNSKLLGTESQLSEANTKLADLSTKYESVTEDADRYKRQFEKEEEALLAKTSNCEDLNNELQSNKQKTKELSRILEESQALTRDLKAEQSSLQLELKQSVDRLTDATDNIAKVEVSCRYHNVLFVYSLT